MEETVFLRGELESWKEYSKKLEGKIDKLLEACKAVVDELGLCDVEDDGCVQCKLTRQCQAAIDAVGRDGLS